MKKNYIKGLVSLIAVFVISYPAFSFSKLPAPAEVPKAQLAFHRESLKPIVAMASTSESDVIHKINLIANNEPLVEVLQQIAEETNISFRVPSDLFSKRISASIHASNWEEGVNELLKDMNRLSVWDKNSHLSQVVILGQKSSTNTTGRETSSMSASNANFQHRALTTSTVASLQNLDQLSESNLRKLLHLQPGNPLPGKLFNEPDVKLFLKSNGIRSPGDWKEFHKARTVHKAIRRELRQIMAGK